MTANEMSVKVNGEVTRLPRGSTVRDVVKLLKADTGPYAVEVNKKLVPRTRHELTPLNPDDEVEVVTLVGGG